MMNASQSVDEVVKESQNKWQKYVVDSPLGAGANELFEKASRIDPGIYKGEAKPYQRTEVHESSIETEKRMSRKSESLDDRLGRQHYDAGRRLPADRQKYSGSFEDVAKQYLSGEGKELYGYLRAKGRDFYDITGIVSAKLKDDRAIAGLAIKGNKAVLAGSVDFEKRVSQLASHYGVSGDRAKSYVLAHEFAHASQKGKYFDDDIQRELDVENTLKEYFSAKGDKDLALIAGDRAANVTRNYGGARSYKPAQASSAN